MKVSGSLGIGIGVAVGFLIAILLQEQQRTGLRFGTIPRDAQQASLITEDSIYCDLCERHWVFILATGRSGSTSLLNMVDSLPHANMGGENGGALNIISELPYFPNNKWGSHLNSKKEPAYKHGKIVKDELFCWVQEYILEIIGNENDVVSRKDFQVHGFKTIRIQDEKIFDFLLTVLPCAKIIFNYRKDVASQHNSSFQQKVPLYELAAENRAMDKFYRKLPSSQRFMLPLEDFTLDNFNEMTRWLGYQDCQYSRVIQAHYNHSYKNDLNTTLLGQCNFTTDTWRVKR